ARQSQMEHEAKPTARDVCQKLRKQIAEEMREDIGPIGLSDTRLTISGSLAMGLTNDQGKFLETDRLGIEQPGFNRLVTRCIPARSAAPYLSDCPPELRARNWHAWATQTVEREEKHILRTRLNDQERCIFSAVSEGYTPFD